jgi:uncharacterized integral membrane protein
MYPWLWSSSTTKLRVHPLILHDGRAVLGGIFDQHDVVEGETIVRWFHMFVIALFVVTVVLFAVQNRQIVTMSFLGFSASVPMALLTGITYLLGMATGGSLLALLRWMVQGARPPSTTTS